MLLSLVARYTPLHEAKTPGEREAIYRFRHSIYGRDLRRDHPGMDHERGMLAQREDELPETRLWYTGAPGGITATARARVRDSPPPEIVDELAKTDVRGAYALSRNLARVAADRFAARSA